MRPTVSKKAVLFVLCLYTFLLSCTKSNSCPDPSSVTINHNGPVIAGWPLRLEADVQSMGYLYRWYGPNGWTKIYEAYASDAYLQEIENITAAGAGEYKLNLIDENGCVAYQGTTMIEVITAPAPPCNIAANTSTSSVSGVGDYNFIYRNFSESSGNYLITGREIVPGGDVMRFAFVGSVLPLPGIYKTNGYFGLEQGKVGLYINAGTYDFVANPDQKVYVNRVNNKIEISFCSLLFNNPLSPANPITISAKIVEP